MQRAFRWVGALGAFALAVFVLAGSTAIASHTAAPTRVTIVEKDGACGEIGNRQLTLTDGSSGTQAVADTVQNWRNVAPCGN